MSSTTLENRREQTAVASTGTSSRRRLTAPGRSGSGRGTLPDPPREGGAKDAGTSSERSSSTMPGPAQALRPLRTAMEPMRRPSTAAALVLGALAFALLLLVWDALTRSGRVDPLFLPSPGATAATGLEMLRSGFMTDVWATVIRVMTGFAISAVVGVPIGVLIGTYAPVTSFLQPVFSFVRYMPASAFIPLFILWIGIDESEKVAVIILGSLPQVVLMVAGNIRNVPASLIEASYTLGTNRANILWKVILPKAAPDVVDTLRIVLGWAWTYVIVAEIVGASSGIGYSILQSQRSMAVDRIFVAIVTLGLIGLIVDNVLLVLNRVVFRWNESKES